jgi:segregation and condensation protein B
MKTSDPSADSSALPNDQDQPAERKFSLSRLSAAFAHMSGTSKEASTSNGADTSSTSSTQGSDHTLPPDNLLTVPAEQSVAISPRMIIEAMLFVGEDDSQADETKITGGLTSQELSSHIRNVSPAEVDEHVRQLNQQYRKETCPYEIVALAGGYRMQLHENYSHVRDRFRSPGRAIKLSPVAMEILAVVAYQQPVTAEQIQKLRGPRSRAVLNQLVNRQLLQLERREDTPRKPWYRTTDRFIRLFQLESLDDLPRSEDLDDS